MKKFGLMIAALFVLTVTAENIKCVSHRGEEFSAPEASRPAFEKAMQLKADIIKLDVRSTSDGVLILCHDDNLKRIMKLNAKVADLTWEKIQKGVFIPVGGFENEKMLTLQDGLQIVKDTPEFWLDAKDNSPKTLDEAIKVMLQAGIRSEQIMIVSFSKTILAYAQQKYPHIRRVKHLTLTKLKTGKYAGYFNGNFRPNIYNDQRAVVKALLAEKKELGLFGVNIPVTAFDLKAYSAESIRQLQANGLWCSAYFVHNAATAEKIAPLGFDAFVTGRINDVRSYCERK